MRQMRGPYVFGFARLKLSSGEARVGVGHHSALVVKKDASGWRGGEGN